MLPLLLLPLNRLSPPPPHLLPSQVVLLEDVTDIIGLVEDHLATMQRMRVDRYFGAHDQLFKDWEQVLELVRDCTQGLVTAQGLWLRLAPYFLQPDAVVPVLKKEAGQFHTAHETFTAAMKNLEKQERAVLAWSRKEVQPHVNVPRGPSNRAANPPWDATQPWAAPPVPMQSRSAGGPRSSARLGRPRTPGSHGVASGMSVDLEEACPGRLLPRRA